MGTDIHFYVERRDGPDAPWQSADKWIDDGHGSHVSYTDAFYSDRNYDLFAILADVRNGRGFAGVKTGDGFVPIAAPRGLPIDMSPELAAFMAQGIEHTPSWLTVAELMSYDWTQTTTKTGVVDLSELARWKLDGSPNSWSGAIHGGGHVTIDATPKLIARIDDILANTQILGHDKKLRTVNWWDLFHQNDDAMAAVNAKLCENVPGAQRLGFQVSWGVAYYESAQQFLGCTLPRLWRLGTPENVRIVFYFDS